VALYKGDFHAREEWKFAPNPTFDKRCVHQLIDPRTGRPIIWDRMDERVTGSCQRVLNEKCSKKYDGVNHLWLVIYARAPVTESHEFDMIIQKLKIPSDSPFERIFILHVTAERGGGYRALEIFPAVRQFISD